MVFQAFQAAGLDLKDQELTLLEGFFNLLHEEAVPYGLSGISGDREIAVKHLVDAGVLASWIRDHAPSAETLMDIGSGAGVPGIPLRILIPHLSNVVLVDTKRRAIEWTQRAADHLGLKGISFQWNRAEDLGRGEFRDMSDIVTCRALAPLDVSMEYSLPLVKPGGIFVAMRGTDPGSSELAQVAEELGGQHIQNFPYTLPWDMGTRHLVACGKVSPCPQAYPRATAKIRKRPIVFHVKHSPHT